MLAGILCAPAFAQQAWAACDTPDNPIVNCSFESGDFSGWLVQDLTQPFAFLRVEGPGVPPPPAISGFLSYPPDGAFAALLGWDVEVAGTFSFAQVVTLPATATAITFSYRAAWDLQTFCQNCAQRTFQVRVEPSSAPPQTTTVLTIQPGTSNQDTGNQQGVVDVSAFAGSTVRINFEWLVPENLTGPAFFQFDDVSVSVEASGSERASAAAAGVNSALDTMGAAVQAFCATPPDLRRNNPTFYASLCAP
jgi:hypothetical protein